MVFLIMWLLADVFAIIGLVLSDLINLQLMLAIYYTVVDTLLIVQGTDTVQSTTLIFG
jgi:hypothetical protein